MPLLISLFMDSSATNFGHFLSLIFLLSVDFFSKKWLFIRKPEISSCNSNYFVNNKKRTN